MVISSNSVEVKQLPTGVKVISNLCYVIAVLNLFHVLLDYFLLDSIIQTIFYKFYLQVLSFTGFNAILAMIGLDVFAGGGTMLATPFIFINLSSIALLGLSLLWFFVGRGLSRGKKWSRISAIMGFAVIGVLGAIFPLFLSGFFYFLSLFALPININIGVYLIFNKNLKSTFS